MLYTFLLVILIIDAVVLITGHFANVDDGDDVLLKRFDKLFSLTPNIPMGTYECPYPFAT